MKKKNTQELEISGNNDLRRKENSSEQEISDNKPARKKEKNSERKTSDMNKKGMRRQKISEGEMPEKKLDRRTPEREIPETKKKKLKEILDLIKENDTFLIVSTMNLPSGQFQEIRKKIRDFAEIRVVKRHLQQKR